MLTEQERQEIDNELRHYPTRRAVVADALKVVQRHRDGWVTDEGVADVAEHLGLSVDEVEGVATFYNLIYRRPVGRHVILLCDSVTCWITGYHGILEHLRGTLGVGLGETTEDGRFTLLPIACLGCCDHSPALMVDDDLHTDLTPERVDALLTKYL